MSASASADSSSAQSPRSYRADTIASSTGPAVAFRPPLPPGMGDRLASARIRVTVARGSGPIRQAASRVLQSPANWSNARSKPAAWVCAEASSPAFGSTAPSSTSARTRFGNSWA